MFAFLFKLYKPKSRMETEGKQQQPEESPKKEAQIEECCENVQANEANLLVTDNEAMESSLDLPNGRRPLPLELYSEIYKCLPERIQIKFIWGMGRGIYGIFRRKLLVKTKRLRNPRKNGWIRTETKSRISPDRLTINAAWKYFLRSLHSTFLVIVERRMITREQLCIISKLPKCHIHRPPGYFTLA